MHPGLLNLYHRLPSNAKDAVASVRGLQLRRWRYGADTDAQVKSAVARERWAPGQWKAWQTSRLRPILQHAVSHVPYYRTAFRDRATSAADLANWPVLRKSALRQSPGSFLAEGSSTRGLRLEQTSGSTGTPLQLWHSRETARAWYALMEARWRAWYGLSRHDRWAILGGQLVVPQLQTEPPFWVWNSALNQLYFSSYHLGEATIHAYVSALAKFRVQYLWGYASSLYTLATLARSANLELPRLRVAISNAEPLLEHQRETIQEVLQCPVRDTYGMSEMVCAASECEEGRMHLWPEVGIYEVLQDDADEPVPPGTPGRLVCTGLLNQDMPLIRYEVGDRVTLAPDSERCPCGRTLPILLSVEGRNDDLILTRDGRRIGRMDPVFKADLPLKEAQIVQESLELIRVLIVPGVGFSERHYTMLSRAIQDRVGDVRVDFEVVSSVPRGPNGKFRGVISKVKPQPPTPLLTVP